MAITLGACGARTGLYALGDAGAPHDAGIDASAEDAHADAPVRDAPTDVLPDVLIECPSGYFIEVSTDASTRTIRGGCMGAPWPASGCMPGLGEDCFTTRGIEGCDYDAGFLFMPSNNCICQALQLGVVNGGARYITGAGQQAIGTSTVDVTGIGSTAATGTYNAVVVANDGGVESIHGAFCVHP